VDCEDGAIRELPGRGALAGRISRGGGQRCS
jgi:hypothetical protein